MICFIVLGFCAGLGRRAAPGRRLPHGGSRTAGRAGLNIGRGGFIQDICGRQKILSHPLLFFSAINNIYIFSCLKSPVMFQLLYPLIRAIQPFLVPVCFVCAWVLVLMLAANLWSAVAAGVSSSKRMHQIPCANCVFFTNDYRLKCPVRPTIALTEEA